MSGDRTGAPRLSRTTPVPPVRAVHLGLGNFFRAHQAWYTDVANAGDDDWGIAAFTGRSPDLAEAMTRQDGLYTLVTRAAGGDTFDVVRSVVAAHAGGDHEAWLRHLASPDVRLLTTTVTEAGYLRGSDGGLDLARPAVRDDLTALRADPRAPVSGAPARLVAGLLARRATDAGPLALVPCDNLPGNGEALARVLRDAAQEVDPSLVAWIDENVAAVTTMVDRITPRSTADDLEAVAAATRLDDRCPVITEPFTEWVLSGSFPGGRPAWEDAGAVLTDDVTPFEDRKLWLLNGGHCLLAYLGGVRGHRDVAEAAADPVCRDWLERWWDVAGAHLTFPPEEIAAYRAALLGRFDNPRIQHRLEQIGGDGSQKLPVRILPVLRRERERGQLPEAAVVVLAAWVATRRGEGAAVADVRSDELEPLAVGDLRGAVPRLLSALDPALADDAELVAAVCSAAAGLRG